MQTRQDSRHTLTNQRAIGKALRCVQPEPPERQSARRRCMHRLSFGSRRIFAGWSLQHAHVLRARERATERRYASRRDAGRLDVDVAMGSYQVRA